MHGDEICVAIDLIEVTGQFNSKVAGAGLGQKRIITDDLHAKNKGAPGDFGADPAQPQHAESLAQQLDSLKLFAIPFARGHRSAGLWHFPGEAEEHGKRELRGRNSIASGSVHDHDPLLGGRLNIHVIHADAGPAHDAQLRGSLDDFTGHLRFRTNEQRDCLFHRGQQVGFRETFGQNHNVEFRPLLQQSNSLGRHGVTDQNLHKERTT